MAGRSLRLAEPVPVTDDELLVAVARGDQQAFSELYDRFAGRVFGIVRRVVRDPAQSEEVAQEVFVRLWRTATRFDPGRGSATTWILMTAHRWAVDHVRSEQAHRDRTELLGAPLSTVKTRIRDGSSVCATSWG